MYQSPFAWYENAVCKGYSYLFYPKEAERPQAKDRREQSAKTLCAVCPVLDSCREYARQNREFGVWGGENEEERFLAGYQLPKHAGPHSARKLKLRRKTILEKESL